MNYCIKFANMELFCRDYATAIVSAQTLSLSFLKVQVWQGDKVIWQYDNTKEMP